MNANANRRAMTDAMTRYDFPTAREIALALRDRLAADGTIDKWISAEFARLLQAILSCTAARD